MTAGWSLPGTRRLVGDPAGSGDQTRAAGAGHLFELSMSRATSQRASRALSMPRATSQRASRALSMPRATSRRTYVRRLASRSFSFLSTREAMQLLRMRCGTQWKASELHPSRKKRDRKRRNHVDCDVFPVSGRASGAECARRRPIGRPALYRGAVSCAGRQSLLPLVSEMSIDDRCRSVARAPRGPRC